MWVGTAGGGPSSRIHGVDRDADCCAMAMHMLRTRRAPCQKTPQSRRLASRRCGNHCHRCLPQACRYWRRRHSPSVGSPAIKREKPIESGSGSPVEKRHSRICAPGCKCASSMSRHVQDIHLAARSRSEDVSHGTRTSQLCGGKDSHGPQGMGGAPRQRWNMTSEAARGPRTWSHQEMNRLFVGKSTTSCPLPCSLVVLADHEPEQHENAPLSEGEVTIRLSRRAPAPRVKHMETASPFKLNKTSHQPHANPLSLRTEPQFYD